MDMDLAAHDRIWRVNCHGNVHACRSLGKPMIERGQDGSIVTLGSINSLLPLPLPAYKPGKAAIERLTQILAAELGRHGTRVNSVAPTYVWSPQLEARVNAGPCDLRKMMSTHALDRLLGGPDDAEAIAFLCSPAVSHITGVLLPADAGWAAAVSYMSYARGVS